MTLRVTNLRLAAGGKPRRFLKGGKDTTLVIPTFLRKGGDMILTQTPRLSVEEEKEMIQTLICPPNVHPGRRQALTQIRAPLEQGKGWIQITTNHQREGKQQGQTLISHHPGIF